MGKAEVNSEVYNEFINGLNLLEIKLVYSEVKAEEDFSPPAEVKVGEEKKYKNVEEGKFIVTHEYKLKGKEKGKAKAGFFINVIYKLTYQSEIPITKKIFDVFSEISLPLHTWPYFRQFVHEMTARMGLPPLIVGLLKFE